MTAPAFQTAASNNASAATTLQITKPTSTANGDLLLAALYHNEGAGDWSLGGWTHLAHQFFSQSSMCVLWKIASGEGANYTFAHDGVATDVCGGILRISGAHATTPIADVQAKEDLDLTGTTFDCPASGTMSWALDYLAVAIVGFDQNANTTPPTNYTERVDVISASTSVGMATRALSAVTSDNPGTFATGVSDTYENVRWTILVSPPNPYTYETNSPTDDITTTGWTSTPLWSKIDEDPGSPDGTVITATAA